MSVTQRVRRDTEQHFIRGLLEFLTHRQLLRREEQPVSQEHCRRSLFYFLSFFMRELIHSSVGASSQEFQSENDLVLSLWLDSRKRY